MNNYYQLPNDKKYHLEFISQKENIFLKKISGIIILSPEITDDGRVEIKSSIFNIFIFFDHL